MSKYYHEKIETLKEIFGCQDIVLKEDSLQVRDRTFPIIQDVIILLDEQQYTPFVRQSLQTSSVQKTSARDNFAPDIQYSFGEEWKSYDNILPEHS